jgi:hypothetical protein
MTEWFRAEVEGDDVSHAAPSGGRETYCGKPVSFPMGAGEPTCPPCLSAVTDADPA